MEKVYIVGFIYDDFADGGFDIMYISPHKESAKAFMLDHPYESLALREYDLYREIDDGEARDTEILKREFI